MLGSNDGIGELFFGKAPGALDGDPVAKDYSHMIDFAFLNYLLREVAGPVHTLLKVSAHFLPKALKDVAVAGDYLDDVSITLPSRNSKCLPLSSSLKTHWLRMSKSLAGAIRAAATC